MFRRGTRQTSGERRERPRGLAGVVAAAWGGVGDRAGGVFAVTILAPVQFPPPPSPTSTAAVNILFRITVATGTDRTITSPPPPLPGNRNRGISAHLGSSRARVRSARSPNRYRFFRARFVYDSRCTRIYVSSASAVVILYGLHAHKYIYIYIYIIHPVSHPRTT